MGPMKTCPGCGGENRDKARLCYKCLEKIVEPPREEFPERALGIAAQFAIFGGLLMALGPFLPFAEAGSFAASGLLKTGLVALPVVSAGAIVAVFGILSLFLKRRYAYWYLPCAAATAALTLYFHLVVRDSLVFEQLSSTNLGLGIYFCYLGALFSLVAGGVSMARAPQVPVRRRLAGVAGLAETAFRPRIEMVMTLEQARDYAQRRKARGL